MTTIKPKFPTLTKEILGEHLDVMKAKVERATAADGQVDVEKLKAEVSASGDAGLQQGLRAILDQFQRTETIPARVTGGCGTRVTAGCGSSPTTRRVDPASLDRGEAASVVSALLHAKMQAGKLDANLDGKIGEAEIGLSRTVPELAGAFLRGAVHTSTAAYEAEAKKWDSAVDEAARRVVLRSLYSEQIDEKASFHAATPDGAEALKWAFREKLVTAPAADRHAEADRGRAALVGLEKGAKDAESSLLELLPFWQPSKKAGHLDDVEVRALLRTEDLASFVESKREAVLAKVGGDYDAWLKGADVPLSEHIPPERLQRTSSSC